MTDEEPYTLAALRTDMRYLREKVDRIELGMYGEDGQGGLCERVSKLESFKNSLLVLAAVIGVGVTAIGQWFLEKVLLRG